MSPRRLKPGAKLGVLLGGFALVAIVTLIVTAERAQPPPDKSVRPSSDRRDETDAQNNPPEPAADQAEGSGEPPD